MAITAGTYTIGATGGANYTTLNAFYADIAVTGLTGELTGVIISNVNFNYYSGYWYYLKLNGFKLKVTSNTYHDGYYKPTAPVLTINSHHQVYITSSSGIDGSMEYSGLRINTVQSLSFGVVDTVNAHTMTLLFKNNIVYGASMVDLNSRNPSKNTVEMHIVNNIFINTSTPSTIRGVTAAYANKLWFENNYLSGSFFGLSALDPAVYEFSVRNCVFAFGSFMSKTLLKATGIQTDKANAAALGVSAASTNMYYGTPFNSGGDIYFQSYINTNENYLKILESNPQKDLGSTALSSYNTAGIRGNARPHSGKYSIGADEFPKNFPVNLGGLELALPQYPYTTEINYGWDITRSKSSKTYYFDNGATYDKRKGKATFLFTATEAEQFKTFYDAYKASYSTSPIAMVLDDSISGWFPFGQDKGNKGSFDVEINLLSKVERTKDYHNLYTATMEFLNVGAYPSYTFVTEEDEGNFVLKNNPLSLAPVSGIRTPEYQVTGGHQVSTVQNEGFSSYSRTIEIDGETEETKFTLVTNLSKMQRVIKFITDNRTGTYEIQDGGGNILGYSFNSLQSNLQIATNTIVITANKYNEYQLDLSFNNG